MTSVPLTATYSCRVFYKNLKNQLYCRDLKCNNFILNDCNCVKCYYPKKNKTYNVVYVVVGGKKIHPYYFWKHVCDSPRIHSSPLMASQLEELYTSGLTFKQIAEKINSSEYLIKNFFLKSFLAFERLKLKKMHFNNIKNNDKIK